MRRSIFKPIRAARLLRRAAGALLGLFFVCGSNASVSFDDSARAAHAMLTRLCDDFGGRHTGSTNNQGAMKQLAEELITAEEDFVKSLGEEEIAFLFE